MSDTECPYCEAAIEINHDDGYGYNESDTYNQQCDECDKYFAFTTSISFYYETSKAPCMNGGHHKWSKPHPLFVNKKLAQYLIVEYSAQKLSISISEYLSN